MKKTSFVLPALLLALCLTLTSCGPSEQPAEPTAAPTEAPTDAPTQAPTASEPSEEESVPAGEGLSFTAVDLDGKSVSAAELFSANRLTLVNLWGTYCGPCIREMPQLEVLSARLKEKGCGIVGVVIDVAGPNDTVMLREAREILEQTGVTYRNLYPWESLLSDLPTQFVPATFFVDQRGRVVGEPAVGARDADAYEALVDELLAQTGQK